MTTLPDWSGRNKEYRESVLKGLNDNEARVSELIAKLKSGKGGLTQAQLIAHIELAQQERAAVIRNLVSALIPESSIPVPREEWVIVPPISFGQGE